MLNLDLILSIILFFQSFVYFVLPSIKPRICLVYVMNFFGLVIVQPLQWFRVRLSKKFYRMANSWCNDLLSGQIHIFDMLWSIDNVILISLTMSAICISLSVVFLLVVCILRREFRMFYYRERWDSELFDQSTLLYRFLVWLIAFHLFYARLKVSYRAT